MSSLNVNFRGYGLRDTKNWSDFQVTDIKPKQWEEDDVDIAILYCGICGFDIQTITGVLGNIKGLPLVAGHEIVGTVVRVGSTATEKAGVKVGDTVGVGARIGSCGECRACRTDNENYCPKGLSTYNSLYPDGTLSQGGYGTAIRAHHSFVFPVPKELKPEYAASMMCAGLTMYSALVRNGAGPEKKVGIIGLGGLGHFGVLFAKALGAEVYVSSHSPHKEQDAKALGADHFVVTPEKGNVNLPSGTLDLIISTIDVADPFPLRNYLRLLFINGTFVSIGVFNANLPGIAPFDIVPNGCRLAGSLVGSKQEAVEMFELAAKSNIHPWIEIFPMSRIKEAVEGMKAGKPKFRYVLKQDLA